VSEARNLAPRARIALVALGSVAALVAGFGALRALPRLTLANAGIRLDYPASALWLGLLAAAGAASVAFILAARPLRIGAAIAAAALLLVAVDRAAFRIDLDDVGLRLRRPLSSARVEWRDVTKVDSGAEVVTLATRSGSSVMLEVGSLTSEQRASLDRAIARRLRGGDAPKP
jgi:hypothetical protein